MLARRILISGVVVLSVLGVTGQAGTGRQEESFVTRGLVRITAAPDGLSALVSVDAGRTDEGDAGVEHAFLVQVTTPLDLRFEGPATLVYTESRLIVTVTPDVEWVFTVIGKDVEPMAVAPAATVVPVVGLSHYWGLPNEAIHEALATQLFARLCERGEDDERGPSCEDCTFGGPGEPSCEIDCPGGTCSAQCGAGFHSCCKCPQSCRCCQDIEQ